MAYYVTSPGAISSTEHRDTSIHQGRFDIGGVLQTHLRTDVACFICDISSAKIIVWNRLCDEYLGNVHNEEPTLGACEEQDLMSLMTKAADKQLLVKSISYLLVSERHVLEPVTLTVLTKYGSKRLVRIGGEQLMGTWWRLDVWKEELNPLYL